MVRTLALLFLLLPAIPAGATTTYRIMYGGSDRIEATPFFRDEVWPLAPGSGATATFTGRGFVSPGHVGLFDRMDISWTGGGGAYLECVLYAETNEFVISGPPGPPVTGTLHARFQTSFARAAGYPWSNSHGGGTQIYVIANGHFATGDYWVGNHSTTVATGVFAGLSGDAIDLPIAVTGTFPVGIPFAVRVQLFGRAQVYGDITTGNPGFSEIDAGNHGSGAVAGGLRLEEVSGRVMTLPAGYTLNCAPWGIVDNRYESTVAVEPVATETGLSVSPSPAAGDVSVAWALPSAGEARVEVFDAAGRRVRTLADGRFPPGPQRARWDGRDEDGVRAPAGVYFVRAVTAFGVQKKRFVRLQ
jgi:hypothetical protein